MRFKSQMSARFPVIASRVKRAANRIKIYAGADHNIFIMDDPDFFDFDPVDDLDRKIAKVMRKFNSDKATNHDYHLPYSYVLSNLPFGPVLEIGLGTNHVDTPSNMGVNGRPGASLRAWRQLGIFTKVWGADVDNRVLFIEPGIETRFVDQLQPETVEALASELKLDHPSGFSLIIDDGLHTEAANINVINGLWNSVMVGGYLCIEDLFPRNLREVLIHVKESIPEATWAVWTNLSIGPDNQMLILKREE